MASNRPLYDAVLELRGVLDQQMAANYQNADNVLKRFVHLLKPESALGTLSAELLPAVDFPTWYAIANGSMGAIVGSGELDFPVDTAERVAIQLELLREVARDPQGIRGFGLTFLSGDYNERARTFAAQIVVSFFNDWLRVITPALENEEAENAPDPALTEATPNRRAGLAPYVAPSRIAELQALQAAGLDFAKLVRMCEEINLSWEHGSYFAVAMLARSIINHVPPVFGVQTFAEVANNIGGTRSFKESTTYLENAARKIADSYLHNPMRSKEALPAPQQVDFSREIDFMLEEIVRRLKK